MTPPSTKPVSTRIINPSDASLTALHRSWRRFKTGLALFIAGATALMTISTYHPALYFISLIVLFSGFVIAMSGYLAILWQRLKVMNPAARKRNRE